MVIRRATHGSGKISLDELNSIFNIQSNREDDLQRGENEIKQKQQSFGAARNVSGLAATKDMLSKEISGNT